MSNRRAAAELPRYVKSTAVQKMLGGINRATMRELVAKGVLPPPIDLTCRLQVYDLDAVVEAVRARTRKVAAAA